MNLAKYDNAEGQPKSVPQHPEAAEGRRPARTAPLAESKSCDMDRFALACLTLERSRSAYACAGKGEVIQVSDHG